MWPSAGPSSLLAWSLYACCARKAPAAGFTASAGPCMAGWCFPAQGIAFQSCHGCRCSLRIRAALTQLCVLQCATWALLTAVALRPPELNSCLPALSSPCRASLHGPGQHTFGWRAGGGVHTKHKDSRIRSQGHGSSTSSKQPIRPQKGPSSAQAVAQAAPHSCPHSCRCDGRAHNETLHPAQPMKHRRSS